MIMVRTLRRDIARYNAGESDSLAGLDETIEETGWKLVHGDVFRPPPNPRLFAAVIDRQWNTNIFYDFNNYM